MRIIYTKCMTMGPPGYYHNCFMKRVLNNRVERDKLGLLGINFNCYKFVSYGIFQVIVASGDNA